MNVSSVNITELTYLIESEVSDIISATNSLWLYICSFAIFFMQAGFGMLTAGSVQEKNNRSILFKNLLELSVTGVAFFLVGYPIAFGNGGLMGGIIGWYGTTTTTNSIPVNPATVSNSPTTNQTNFFESDGAHKFIMYGFATSTATIVSGAVAERIRLSAFLWLIFAVSIFIQPIIMHWVWSSVGWASSSNMNSVMQYYLIDNAGSGVIHLVGGVIALIAAATLGPRMRPRRFTKEGKVKQITGSNASFAVLGTLLLWFCWYGFNSCSIVVVQTVGQQQYDNNSAGGGKCSQIQNIFDREFCYIYGKTREIQYQVVGRILMNTSIAPMVSCVICSCLGWLLNGIFEVRGSNAIRIKKMKKIMEKERRQQKQDTTDSSSSSISSSSLEDVEIDSKDTSKSDSQKKSKTKTKQKKKKQKKKNVNHNNNNANNIDSDDGDNYPAAVPSNDNQPQTTKMDYLLYFLSKCRFDLSHLLNGILIGLVGITAGAATVTPSVAAISGAISGVAYLFFESALLYFQIDDPINSSCVHAAGGIVGLLASAFSDSSYVNQVYDRSFPGVWQQLLVQLIGIVIIIAWSTVWTYITFGIFNRIKTNKEERPNILRIPLELEEWGADLHLNWGIGKTKLKRTLADYLSRVQSELPAADPLDEMNNDSFLNLPTAKAVLRLVVDKYKPHFIKKQEGEESGDEGDDYERRNVTKQQIHKSMKRRSNNNNNKQVRNLDDIEMSDLGGTVVNINEVVEDDGIGDGGGGGGSGGGKSSGIVVGDIHIDNSSVQSDQMRYDEDDDQWMDYSISSKSE